MVGQWCEGGNGGSVVLWREWWVSGVREGMVGQWCEGMVGQWCEGGNDGSVVLGREWWVSGVREGMGAVISEYGNTLI